ncbi:MAG: nickel pincer cofactor biosynthesis protein LarC [Planctomycetota bacterium]|jgi:uncharacterized protein (TIGR00299 family) protein
MKIAYFDCFAGASGDMIAAAMLDAGLDADFLKSQLATLGIKGLSIQIAECKRAGLRAIRFEPVAPEHQRHRNLEQIIGIISHSGIGEQARKNAIGIFERLAQAEGAVHGKDPNEIHFHEVGAVDSIVDIVSASVGFEALGIQKAYCSTISIGGGSVKCAHGLLPVPAPATVELLKGIAAAGGPIEAELLTPTGAAILTDLVDEFGPLPAMKIEAIGCGAGSLDPDEFPNVLRLIVGQAAAEDSTEADTVCLLETNVDDATGELIAFVSEQLFEKGALDVFTTAIVMKHSRPAVQISVICRVEDTTRLEQLLFEQGLTFGVRRQLLQRSKLSRDFVTVKTKFGSIRIKTGFLRGKIVNVKPEYSDCAAAAGEHNVALKAVFDAAIAAYKKGSHA